ncbi:hypothetical protein DEJ50_17005 [Streptomyces venezuelae]|uniref:Uncharacterized protein n=1 Tax=Streptomyces venezuelae TaxID=54571 RepID=A0A5P2D3W6_STRVZ|nr:hypothetical protein [Streptomyces venezuelae]QES49250.1 hypothetical protein DEJ50_17005 [Streptomyces venezuelae]
MAHAAPTAARRHRAETSHLSWTAYVGPLTWGLVYGVYAAFMKRQMGPVDAANVFYGILCGLLFAAGMFALARLGPKLMRELHAAAYGAFAGITFGYLYSLSGESVMRSTCLALAVGAGVGLIAFYRYYTRED